MKIVLKPDWDIPSQYPSKENSKSKGHFAGRKRELSVLCNELIRKDQGAILVSGYRGVGKTSFIYKTLQSIFDNPSNKQVLAVLINCSFLDDESESNGIIVNLIRRLFAVSLTEKLPQDIRDEIEMLYQKAVSTEYKQTSSLEEIKQSTYEKETSFSLIGNADKIGINQLIWFVCFIAAIFLQIYPIAIFQDWLNKIMPLLLAFPLPLILSFAVESRKSNKEQKQKINSANKLYTIDNNLSNLEFDLDKLHYHLSKKGIKTIYVLDELDKLNTSRVTKILKYFKNFFTLSHALFIFVGGEELSSMGIPTDKSKWQRPIEYTYFTSRYFLSRPSVEELHDFIDEIVIRTESSFTSQQYEDLKRAFILDARGDYYDLIQVIKGNITSFSNDCPVIELDANKEIIRKSKMQQIVNLLYTKKYFAHHPQKWAENEFVLREFYDIGNLVLGLQQGGEIVNEFPVNKTYAIDRLANTDLLKYLYKLGILELVKQEEKSGGRYEPNVIETTYSYTDALPESIPQELYFTSQLEEVLIRKTEQLYNCALNFCNLYACIQTTSLTSLLALKENPYIYFQKLYQWGLKSNLPIKKIKETYDIVSNGQQNLSREIIESHITTLSDTLEQVQADSAIIMATLLKDALSDGEYELVKVDEKLQHQIKSGWDGIIADIIKRQIQGFALVRKGGGMAYLICLGTYGHLERFWKRISRFEVVIALEFDKPDIELVYDDENISIRPHLEYPISEIKNIVDSIQGEELELSRKTRHGSFYGIDG